MVTVEDTVKEALQRISPCPRYDSACVTAPLMSRLNCSIYGCNVAKEHSALYKICNELHVNGDLKKRRQITQLVRNEVAEGRYQFGEH